ncbi:hypothetical protein HDU96_002739 [Phlyctochytrium bullatum]|nr:hypothetical protein HDU96_002739 [Phlyctochytrium bullatum]
MQPRTSAVPAEEMNGDKPLPPLPQESSSATFVTAWGLPGASDDPPSSPAIMNRRHPPKPPSRSPSALETRNHSITEVRDESETVAIQEPLSSSDDGPPPSRLGNGSDLSVTVGNHRPAIRPSHITTSRAQDPQTSHGQHEPAVTSTSTSPLQSQSTTRTSTSLTLGSGSSSLNLDHAPSSPNLAPHLDMSTLSHDPQLDWTKIPVYSPPPYSPPGTDPPPPPPAPAYDAPAMARAYTSTPAQFQATHQTLCDPDHLLLVMNDRPGGDGGFVIIEASEGVIMEQYGGDAGNSAAQRRGAKVKKVPLVRCCGCFNLRLGCVVIALVYLLQSFANLAQSVGEVLFFSRQSWIPKVLGPLSLALMMGDCVGVHAASQRKLRLLRAYSMIVWFRLVALTSLQLTSTITSPTLRRDAPSYAIIAVFILLQTYFNVVIASYCCSLYNLMVFGIVESI